MKYRAILLSIAAIVAFEFSRWAMAQSPIEADLQKVSWALYQDEAVKLMQEYLRIDTSNPPGNELAAAEFFHRLFSQTGIPNTIYTYAPGRANIYAVLKGDGTLRPLVLLNHMDVVRADPKNWKVPPFSGEIVNGEMYGRGAEDMKDEGLLQAMVMLIAAREHLPLKRDLIFLGTADEEVGDTGSAWLIEHHPEQVRQAEYLITEGGANLLLPGSQTLYEIDVAEKAPFWIRMTATGRGGHGSSPIADSAPDRLVKAMNRVIAWEPPIRVLPFVEENFRSIAPQQKEPRATQFRDIRKALTDRAFAKAIMEDEDFNYLLHDTISLTVMKGSEQTNVIPDTASCEFDIRLLPGEDPAVFLAQLRKVVADEQIQLEPISRYRKPNSSPTNTMLYRLFEEAIREHNPQALIAPALGGGYTECQMYRELGINCYGFVPVEITTEV